MDARLKSWDGWGVCGVALLEAEKLDPTGPVRRLWQEPKKELVR